MTYKIWKVAWLFHRETFYEQNLSWMFLQSTRYSYQTYKTVFAIFFSSHLECPPLSRQSRLVCFKSDRSSQKDFKSLDVFESTLTCIIWNLTSTPLMKELLQHKYHFCVYVATESGAGKQWKVNQTHNLSRAEDLYQLGELKFCKKQIDYSFYLFSEKWKLFLGWIS